MHKSQLIPYVKPEGDWERVGFWYNNTLMCSHGDCPHWRCKIGVASWCRHPDGLRHQGGGLCPAYYRGVMRLCAKLLAEKKDVGR